MITINKNIQSEILMTTMEEIVPEDSIFRKIDKYIDFTFIYDKVKDLYCDNNGRPSIDPVVLFKIVFIQALDGLKSMRQTCKKLKVDAEYRWFLGIPFGIDTPHFSTFSKNYERRFKDSDIFEVVSSLGVFDTGIASAAPLHVYKVTGLVLKSTLEFGPKYALVHVSRQVSPGQTSL